MKKKTITANRILGVVGSPPSLLVKFFEKSLKYLEMNLIGKILVPGVSRRGDILRKEDRLEEAFKLGKRLATYRRRM